MAIQQGGKLSMWTRFDRASCHLEWRKLGRTGITLFEVCYWNDAFASLIGRGKEKVQVRFDPRNLSKIWVQVDDGRMIEGALPKSQSSRNLSLGKSPRPKRMERKARWADPRKGAV